MQLLNDADIKTLALFVVKELREELVFQKHVNTRELLESIFYRVNDRAGGGLSIDFTAEDYALFINRGRKAGTKRVPIAALVDWIKQRGFATGDKKILSIAFAIQEKIFREGIPTRNARNVARRRTEFVDFTMNRIEDEILNALERASVRNIEQYMSKVIDKANKNFIKL